MANENIYWQQIDSAILEVKSNIANIETAMSDDPLSDEDWFGALYVFETQLRQLEFLRYAHRLCRMNDAEAEELLLTAQNGGTRQSRTYIVTINDTPESIQAIFGVPIEQILNYNNLVVDDLRAGIKIIIPIQTPQTFAVSDSIPVYDSHTGNSILGKDIYNEMAIDVDGDLQETTPEECFEQGIRNIIDTNLKEHPLLPLFGWDKNIPNNLPEELEIKWRALGMSNAIKQDTRVSGIRNFRAEIDGESVKFFADIIAVNGLQQGVSADGLAN